MEITSPKSPPKADSSFPILLFLALLVAALVSFFVTHFGKRARSGSSRGGAAAAEHLNGGVEEMVEKVDVMVPPEKQTGASMMEQLVPEITTHALSYLDYPSLCRLSMTNSLMRKAANDDNAWKALYLKDFTVEQYTVTPVNGWKAYYAATRAVMNVNNEFFAIISNRSIVEMRRFWLNADYVKCFHATGAFSSGYNAVIQSWQVVLDWDNDANYDTREVKVRVLPGMAWVTTTAFLPVPAGLFSMTNIYEFHNGRWVMVHHHSSRIQNAGHMLQG